MNQRERFLATAGFQPGERTFLLAPWAWPATIRRWQAEAGEAMSAMGPSADDEVFDDAALRRMSEGLAQVFHTDCEQTAPVAMQGAYGPHLVPGLPRKVLEETAEQQVVQDEEGNVVRLYKGDATRSMPQWLRYPMQGRSDWETIIRPRLSAGAGAAPQGPAPGPVRPLGRRSRLCVGRVVRLILRLAAESPGRPAHQRAAVRRSGPDPRECASILPIS